MGIDNDRHHVASISRLYVSRQFIYDANSCSCRACFHLDSHNAAQNVIAFLLGISMNKIE